MTLGFAEGVRSAEEALAVATKACVVCGLDIDVNDMPPEMESCKDVEGSLGISKHTLRVNMCVPTTSKKHCTLVSFFHSQQVFRSLGVGDVFYFEDCEFQAFADQVMHGDEQTTKPEQMAASKLKLFKADYIELTLPAARTTRHLPPVQSWDDERWRMPR